jgi:RTX calcium-binding nonapeptide repeat (4 copies)
MSRSGMRHTTSAMVVVLGLTVPTASFGAARATTASVPARVAMCDGHRATVVAGPDETFRGTAHRDVIAANPKASGNAGGGDDVICLRGDNLTHVSTTIAAGAGDDVVLAQEADAVRDGMPTVLLGQGNDVYQGGVADDVVTTGAGHDRVLTHEGNDHVVDGGPDTVQEQSLGVSHAARSVIRLGLGNESVDVAGRVLGGSVDGGRGLNSLTLSVVCRDVPVSVDLKHHVMRVDHHPVLQVSRFDALHTTLGPGGLRYIGRPFSDVLFLDRGEQCDQPASRRVDLTMGAGSDDVSASFPLRGRYDGGSGRDDLSGIWAATTRLDIDLNGPVTEDGVTRLRLHSVDNLGLDELKGNPEVTVTGTARPERIALVPGFTDQAASITLRGGAGNDHFVSNGAANMFGGPGNDVLQGFGDHPVRLEGQSGNDLLAGGDGDDVLIGGKGQDKAHGKDGTDQCDAELETNCELTP